MVTVSEQIRRLLPKGARPFEAPDTWDRIPFWPPDVFAVTATLVERSSAYRHVIGPDLADDGRAYQDRLGVVQPEWQTQMAVRASAWSWGLLAFPMEGRSGSAWDTTLEILKASLPVHPGHQAADSSYKSWKDLIEVDLAPLHKDWHELYHKHGGALVIRDGTAASPGWWAPAMRLLVTADTACKGIGFRPRPTADPASATAQGAREYPTWVQLTLHAGMHESDGDDSAEMRRDRPFFATVTSEVFNRNLGAVLPKTRTSPMGCTLRSLTHHLSLLPPPGTVEARWRMPGQRPPPAITYEGGQEHYHPLTLLLVPFPYRISPKSFESAGDEPQANWGYFHLHQTWLRKDGHPISDPDHKGVLAASRRELSNFVQSLVEAANEEMGDIHGVIFPELSLDARTFEEISKDLLADAEQTGFEFVVAGLSQRPGEAAHRPGNYAAFRGRVRTLHKSKAKSGASASMESAEKLEWDIIGGREKHHRWKLNKLQIERYGLSSRLKPEWNWWEAIPISRRIVEFIEVRAGTSMTILICEDLARADPCQTVVRSIGPNLVIALLLDGPQKLSRWPAHYAGVLADDPGSTVLTLSSFGLIDRCAVTEETQSRSVALFKDCLGVSRELQLPVGCHALAVRLEPTSKTEHTLDGRGDGNAAYIWRLREVCPIRGESKPWITGD